MRNHYFTGGSCNCYSIALDSLPGPFESVEVVDGDH